MAALAGVVSHASAVELSPTQVQEAHKIYINKCAKCHELYNPKAYSDAEWDKWMVKMKKKSKLKQEQFDLLMGYTATLRKDSHSLPTK
jgi:hypothetical protein